MDTDAITSDLAIVKHTVVKKNSEILRMLASVGRYQYFTFSIQYYKFKTVFGISRYLDLVQIHKLNLVIGIFVA